jgi:plastocyanin
MNTRLTRLLAIGVTAAGVACSDDSTGTAGACAGRGADFVVDGTDGLRFSPANLTITAGQTVCWQNRGSQFHTVTSDDGPGSADDGTTFNSNLGAGAFFVRTFATAGSFPYHCIPHLSNGMVGTITVQ